MDVERGCGGKGVATGGDAEKVGLVKTRNRSR